MRSTLGRLFILVLALSMVLLTVPLVGCAQPTATSPAGSPTAGGPTDGPSDGTTPTEGEPEPTLNDLPTPTFAPETSPTEPAGPTTKPVATPTAGMKFMTTPTGTKMPAPSNFTFTTNNIYALNVGVGADTLIIMGLAKSLYGLDTVVLDATAETVVEILTARIAAGEPTDLVTNLPYPDSAVSNLLAPVDGMINYDISWMKKLKGSYDSFVFKGSHWALMIDSIALSNVFFNIKMFADAGLENPRELYLKGQWNWDTFTAAAKALTIDSDMNGVPERYGVSICNWHQGRLAYTTGQNVVKYVGGKFQSNLTNPAFARSMQWCYDMIKTDKYCDPNRDLSYTQGVFNSGKVPMLITASWMGINGKYLNTQKKTDNLGYAPLPKDPASANYYTGADAVRLYLCNGSTNKDAVSAYIYCGALYYYEQNIPGTPSYTAKKNDAQKWIPQITDAQYERYAKMYEQYNNLFLVPDIYGSFIDIDYHILVAMLDNGKTFQQAVAEYEPTLNDKLSALND